MWRLPSCDYRGDLHGSIARLELHRATHTLHSARHLNRHPHRHLTRGPSVAPADEEAGESSWSQYYGSMVLRVTM
jgi:hypothetical protein